MLQLILRQLGVLLLNLAHDFLLRLPAAHRVFLHEQAEFVQHRPLRQPVLLLVPLDRPLVIFPRRLLPVLLHDLLHFPRVLTDVLRDLSSQNPLPSPQSPLSPATRL